MGGALVTLTWGELLTGARVGVDRRVAALKAGSRPRYDPPPREAWGHDVGGALAELAFAKGAGLYWPAAAERDKDAGDVGGYHVRSTELDTGSLVLQRDDNPAALYVLLVGQYRHWRIVGTLWGVERAALGVWRTDVAWPAFFVPQRVLTPWPGVRPRPAALDGSACHSTG
jgi:hypothetical protein